MKDIETLPKLHIRGQIAPRDSFMKMMGETFSAADVVDFLKANAEVKEIVVEISSDGGYRSEGVEIYQLLKNSGKKVTTITYKANSIATVIMLAGSTRLITEYASVIVHFARIDPVNLGIDPLTAADFQRLSEETERADKQIVDIYCAELGEEKRTELLAAMSDERSLGAKGAIKLGFATGYYKKAKKEKLEVEDFKGVCIDNFIADIIQNKFEDMADKTKLELMIENFGKLLTKAISKIKNEVTLTLADGKTQIYAVPVDPANPGDLMNAKVYAVDEAGVPTEEPAPDGEHTLDDGKVIVVSGGIVTEVRDAVDVEKLKTEAEAAKTENATLKAEIENLKLQIQNQATDKVQMKAELDVVINAFEKFKKEVPGVPAKDKDKDKDEVVDLSKMSRVQKLMYYRKEEMKAKNAVQ